MVKSIRAFNPLLPLLGVLLLGILSCSPTPEFKVVRAAQLDVESLITSVNAGTVKADREVDLSFGAVGRVKKLSVKIGDRVVKDAVLAELENDDLKEILETAANDLTRSQALLRSKVLATTDNDNARRSYEMAKATFEKSLIRAPFDGIVTELNLEIGQLSQITAVIPKPLIRLIDTEPRYVRAEIDEADLPKLSLGLASRVRVPAVRKEVFLGSVRRIVPYVSSVREQDRTVTIDIDVPTKEILLPVGASADVELLVGTEQGAIAVPSRAVLGRGNNRYVFTLANNRATKTPIEAGLSNYDRTAIHKGISIGDTVILPNESVEIEEGLAIQPKFESWP